jgi:hypothetical protein
MDDPILGLLTIVSVTLVCILNAYVNKNSKLSVFLLPFTLMGVGLVIFLGLVILQGIMGIFWWYTSMSLWNGGFFGLFHAIYLNMKTKKYNKKS